jgi:hypothetical protein
MNVAALLWAMAVLRSLIAYLLQAQVVQRHSNNIAGSKTNDRVA